MILEFVRCFLLKIGDVYQVFPNTNSNGEGVCSIYYRDDRLFNGMYFID